MDTPTRRNTRGTAQEAADDVPGPRRGRPRSNRAQEAIKSAAARLFADNGITNTSVRDIAAAAGVDPAIVIRHFGSKEALFLQIMSVGADLPGLVDGPLQDLGRTILRRLIEDRQESLLPVYRALLGALDRPDVRSFVETMMERQIVQPILGRLTGPDRQLRARLVAAQINGLLLALALQPHPDLQATPSHHLLDTYAPALQALITDPSRPTDDADPPTVTLPDPCDDQ